ncbi:hypothetical protein [Terrarubrum flagellatum]|uniref:hypothetical protein n=1 Tax=Terrirubrum flagellatum TaxID=2895980 RepID=UPI0031456193
MISRLWREMRARFSDECDLDDLLIRTRAAKPLPSPRQHVGSRSPGQSAIPLSWLRAAISKREAEKLHDWEGAPFCHLNTRWNELTSAMKPSDEIWLFSSPAESWKMKTGLAGVAVVRDGVAIATIITEMN